MDIRSYLASCLEEAALVVSDGSRPFTEPQATAIADALLADAKLSFTLDQWDVVSLEGQEHLAEAVAHASGRHDEAKAITGHLLWYEERLGIAYSG